MIITYAPYTRRKGRKNERRMRKPGRSIDETIVSLGQRQMIDRLVDRCPVEVGRPIAAYRILSSRVTRARERGKKKRGGIRQAE